MNTIAQIIATELAVQTHQVEATITLLDEGATVPFIARYRKEVTGGLDDTQLRNLEERLRYLRELEERRTAILTNIQEQNKLTAELEVMIRAAATKTRLEDLYLPYKPKRSTKAQIAREAGLEPLARALLHNPDLRPEHAALAYLNDAHKISNVKTALEGARQILMEIFTEDPELNGQLRERLWEQGVLHSKVATGKEQEGAKFADYFDFNQPIHNIPPHRTLALLRGRKECFLILTLAAGASAEADQIYQSTIAQRFEVADRNRAADPWLLETVRWAWRLKLFTRLELELINRLKEIADNEAIKVFAQNIKDLLLAAPAGRLPIIGLDPGLRTGVKLAVVDATGKVTVTDTIYPHPPKNQWDQAIVTLATLAQQHQISLISIGNGTASRETDKLVRDLIKRHPELGLRAVVVSEAGASVYSASELAAREFPTLDVTLRGAVSIARRLQDPLAELVKIEPKAIGVGQYQHDVNQSRLARTLDYVVEDCVNSVGVNINTASASLLTRVSGLNRSIAENIIAYRDGHGAFKNRDNLKQVPRLGDKTFQLAAGFLRILDGDNPLDASAVHPESYPVVERIIQTCGRSIRNIIGDSSFLRKLDPQRFTDTKFGLPTVRDILAELEKPGLDPRPEFKTPIFLDGIQDIKDLHPGMILEGTATNVTNFGAFVDIGVHQDGLIHISAMSEQYIKSPRDLVKAGDLVRVKVLEIDPERKRIALTMRIADRAETKPTAPAPATKPKTMPHSVNQTSEKTTDKGKSKGKTKYQEPRANNNAPPPSGAMAEALARALKGNR